MEPTRAFVPSGICNGGSKTGQLRSWLDGKPIGLLFAVEASTSLCRGQLLAEPNTHSTRNAKEGAERHVFIPEKSVQDRRPHGHSYCWADS